MQREIQEGKKLQSKPDSNQFIGMNLFLELQLIAKRKKYKTKKYIEYCNVIRQ